MKQVGSRQSLSVCHVVAYRDPQYVRTRTLRAALKIIDDCRIIDATNEHRGLWRYVETTWKIIRARIRHNPDVYLLGFRGHEIFWIVRLITMGKRLVFDAFLSPSDALISDKKLGKTGKLLGYLIFPLEYCCLRLSDICITDTQLHKSFLSKRFHIPLQKLNVVYVGAEPDTAGPTIGAAKTFAEPTLPLSVLFYGTFLPLHGIEVLLEACKLLESKPIEFHIIGGKGKSLTAFRNQLKRLELRNVHHQTWVGFDELQSIFIPRADLCLGGPFGGTPQAQRVITGKTFQFLMQGKATVIGETKERAGLIDRVNCLLVSQSDPKQIAIALNWALDHRHDLSEIGRRGKLLFHERFSAVALARQLEPALRSEL